MHSHARVQLTFAASGVIQVHVDKRPLVGAILLGVWIPAGASHQVEVLTDAQLWMVHWERAFASASAPVSTQLG